MNHKSKNRKAFCYFGFLLIVQTPPSVAIVILNYNTRHYLQKFLPSVLSSTYPNQKIIVGDNASTDDSVNWLRENYPQIQIVINKENHGFAKGYNQVLKEVCADYYVLLNSDVEVSADWVEPVIQLMQSDSNIAACQPKLLSYHNKNLFEYAGACGGWIDALGYPFSRGRVFDVCEADTGQYDNIEPIFWASGAAMFVRANVYHQMHGLDEYFFAHQEEIDLCWRMQLAGYSIMSCPKSVVYHVGGGTLPKGRRKVFLNFRNNLVMIAKNWTWKERLQKFPLRIGMDILSAGKAYLGGDKDFFIAVLKGHLAFGGWMLSKKSENIFPSSRAGKVNGMFNGSVVWQYFVRKKKTFREIIE